VTAARHRSTTIAGLAVTSATMTWTAAAWTQERLAARWTGRRLVTGGLLIVGAGIGLVLLALPEAVPLPVMVLGWALAGFGIGLSYSPLSTLVLRAAPEGRQGAASAALQLADNLGTALGAGTTGAIIAATTAGATSRALAIAFGLTIGVAVLGALAARRLPGVLLASAASSDAGPL
jgi:MFS family permease